MPKIRVQINKEDMAYLGQFLLISARLELSYLKDVFIEIKTHLEGTKRLNLGTIYEKTEAVPEEGGKKCHFFRIVTTAKFIGAKEAELWRINDEGTGVVGKRFSI